MGIGATDTLKKLGWRRLHHDAVYVRSRMMVTLIVAVLLRRRSSRRQLVWLALMQTAGCRCRCCVGVMQADDDHAVVGALIGRVGVAGQDGTASRLAC